MKRLFLRQIGSKEGSVNIAVPQGQFTIGRDEEADFQPPSDLASRRHCVLHFSGGEIVVEDLGSRNGTFVNGERVEGKQSAGHGSSLRIGRLLFELVVTSSTGELPAKDSQAEDLFKDISQPQQETAFDPGATIDADGILNKFFDRGE
jgi:pSer/pThr/pTyr-binding forkhead associated (FHA) protein